MYEIYQKLTFGPDSFIEVISVVYGELLTIEFRHLEIKFKHLVLPEALSVFRCEG